MEKDILNGVWPEWEIVRQIGRGSFGIVYEAVRRDLFAEDLPESHAAIKVISIPQNGVDPDSFMSEGWGYDESRTFLLEIVNDFVNEIRLMETFKGVQNIVSVEDYKVVEQSDGVGWTIYIRMELLTPLSVYMAGKNIGEAEVLRLGCDICSALEVCAKRNVIHRDIKPENIFVNHFGDFKLGDFGIARKLENMTSGLSRKGTGNYMAPEVRRSQQYDARVDLYSLGLVMYRLTNKNRMPFLDTEKQLLSPDERMASIRRRMSGEKFPPPCEASPELAAIILRACAFDPQDRYESAAAMKQALQSVAGESPQNSSIRISNEKKPGRKCKLWIPVVAAAAVAAVCFLCFLNGDFRQNIQTTPDETVSVSSGIEVQEDADINEAENLSDGANEQEETVLNTDSGIQEQEDDEEGAVSREAVLEMTGLFPQSAKSMLSNWYAGKNTFLLDLEEYEEIDREKALRLAAMAVMETEAAAIEDPTIRYYLNGQVEESIYDLQGSGRGTELFLPPEGTYARYLEDLFGISTDLSDVEIVYNDLYPEDTAPMAVQGDDGQFYFMYGDFSEADFELSIEDISDTPDSDGAYTVTVKYLFDYSAYSSEVETEIYYMAYRIIPSEVSEYGYAIVGMSAAGNGSAE